MHWLSTLRAIPFLIALCLAALSLPARAQDAQSLVSRFASENFGELEAAVTALAASGVPMAATVITAMGESRLVYDQGSKIVYIRQADGSLVHAVTGAKAEGVTTRPVRLNNRVRSAIAAAIGTLTLLAPDPQKRYQAAESVFKSRDKTSLPALEAALAQERDARVRTAMEAARAAIIITDKAAPEADRIRSVEAIRARADQEALALLASVQADAPQSVRDAAAAGQVAIQRSLALWGFGQNAWYGLSLGSVLLLAAIGLAITFGVMGVINMAHGEMVMIGAYVTFIVQELIRTKAPFLYEASLFIAIPLAFLVAGAIGVLIERGLIRYLYGRPLETLLATWGVSLILQQAVRAMFGPTNREVGTPAFMSGAMQIGQMQITYNRLAIVIFTIAVFFTILLVLKKTPFGLYMRAVTQNRRMAGAMGIRTPRVDALTFGLGSGIAGIAGVALSQIDNVSPNLGQSYIIDSFLVVVFGGVGNLWGTLVAALSLGIANKFLEPYAGAVLGKILLLVFIILFIQKRPRGLFAQKGRAVE